MGKNMERMNGRGDHAAFIPNNRVLRLKYHVWAVLAGLAGFKIDLKDFLGQAKGL